MGPVLLKPTPFRLTLQGPSLYDRAVQPDDRFYVFGLEWWPFDGAVTGAFIAAAATFATIYFNHRRFKSADSSQQGRHEDVVSMTTRLSERELLNRDIQRAEEALANNDANHWVYAGVILREVNLSEHATDADRRRARHVMRAFKERVTPSI